MVSSRAKLGYATVNDRDLPPGFADLARRIEAAETRRGAARVDPPQQQVIALPGGGYGLDFRPMTAVEQANAALSLAANLAIADTLFARRPACSGSWPNRASAPSRGSPYRQGARARLAQQHEARGAERSLDPNDKRDAAFMLAVRRAGSGARCAVRGR